MSYKVLRVINISYIEIFRHFFKKNPQALQSSYNHLIEIFKLEHYNYLNSFEEAMVENGNMAELIIYNFETLQDKWLQENQTIKLDDSKKDDKLFKIFCLQLDDKKPDVLLFQHSTPFNISKLKELKKDFPFIKKIIFHNGIPIENNNLKYVDCVFAALPYLVNYYKNQGAESTLVYHYFDTDIISKLTKPHNYVNDLIFIGKTGALNDENHINRLNYLIKILENKNIKFKCHSLERERQEFLINKLGFKSNFRNKLINFLKNVNLNYLKNLKSNYLPKKINNLISDIFKNEKKFYLHEIYENKVNLPLFGMEMYEQLKQSKIIFNIHTNQSNYNCGNLRMFETTGIGSCLLTDYKQNIEELFIPDEEILTYKDYDEFSSKYFQLISNNALLNEISLKGQKKTFKQHSTKIRVEQINNLINKMLS